MSEIKCKGACLCGAVAFEAEMAAKEFGVCHCEMCRQWSAGPFMAVQCLKEPAFEAGSGEHLRWYRSSEWAERGFCKRCGTSLFYRMVEAEVPFFAVSAESLAGNEDLKLRDHIFIDMKPARYDFSDDCPRLTQAEVFAAFSGEGEQV